MSLVRWRSERAGRGGGELVDRAGAGDGGRDRGLGRPARRGRPWRVRPGGRRPRCPGRRGPCGRGRWTGTGRPFRNGRCSRRCPGGTCRSGSPTRGRSTGRRRGRGAAVSASSPSVVFTGNQVVVGLYGDVAGQVLVGGEGQGRFQALRRDVGGGDLADLAGLDEFVEDREEVGDVEGFVVVVGVVEVDVVGAQTGQGLVDGGFDGGRGQALVVRVAPTLVAMTTWSRLPREASQLPMTVSDSPPLLPGTQAEYTSAVSMKCRRPRRTRPARRRTRARPRTSRRRCRRGRAGRRTGSRGSSVYVYRS
ncbi:hypothetical protein SRIMM317S_05269 [Streptomyces rimosus subsp. rimosus]